MTDENNSVQVQGGDGVQRLERANQQLNEILESIQDDFYVLDRDWVFVYANHNFARRIGKEPHELVGRNIWHMFPKHLGTSCEFNLRAAMERGETRRFEVVGKYTDAIYRMTAFPSAEGITVLGADITQSKQDQQLLRDVIDGSPNLIVFLKDRQGRYLAVNKHLEALVGKPQDELLGKTDYDIFSKQQADYFVDHDRQVLETGKAILIEEEADLAGGHYTFLASKFPLRDGVGAVYGVGAVSHDITERKRMQRELETVRSGLEEANQHKSAFLAILSHELRNPLTAVKNSLYILQRATPGGEQGRRARDVIERQVDQLGRLVDDLLDVNRIARGKVQLQRMRFELNELARHTLEDHRGLFDGAGLRLCLETTPHEIFVYADRSRVAQVLGNLLQNAAKFTPPDGEVSVVLTSDASTRQAILRVRDTGVGFSPGLRDQLFEPFMQADSTLDRSKGGLGLGLALVKGLVELHGGSVVGNSGGDGQGAEFVVRLPLDISLRSTGEREAAAASTGQRRVLVVEDNVDAATTLCDALELCGHTVEVAFSGPEGLTRARVFRPDIVLCDIGLPGMDGFQVARAFRADESFRDVRLIAVSGYALPEDLQRAAEAGFDRHLAKPASLEKLESVISNAKKEA